MSRTRSVEELLSSSPEPSGTTPTPDTQRARVPSKGTDSKVDWKGFQEAVSFYLSFFSQSSRRATHKHESIHTSS